MRLIIYFSELMIPLLFVLIIIYGLYKKVDVYSAFLEGAREGVKTVFEILPTLISLMCAVAVMRACGLMDVLIHIIKPITDMAGFPAEVIPMALMRVVSSSAATGMAIDLFKVFGPDSFIGRLASVMMGCTETILYTMTVYFTSIGIKDSGYTLVGALIANVSGIIASFYIVLAVFGR